MLDKGLVIAGDIKVSLAEVELLTIRIRLLICSLDKAQEIGLDWWRYDRELSPGADARSSPKTKNFGNKSRARARVEALTPEETEPPRSGLGDPHSRRQHGS